MAFIDSGKTFDKEEHYEKMKKKMENLEVSQYPLRIPKNLYRDVKIKLAQDGRIMRDVLIEALEKYLKD